MWRCPYEVYPCYWRTWKHGERVQGNYRPTMIKIIRAEHGRPFWKLFVTFRVFFILKVSLFTNYLCFKRFNWIVYDHPSMPSSKHNGKKQWCGFLSICKIICKHCKMLGLLCSFEKIVDLFYLSFVLCLVADNWWL